MFNRIVLSYTDSATEMQYAPEVLAKAFVDVGEVIERLERPERYLVVGPKGAGKTAVASHLLIKSKKEADCYCALENLEEFQYQKIDGLILSPENVDGTGVERWTCLLNLRLLALVSQGRYLKGSSKAAIQIAAELNGNPGIVRSLQGLVDASTQKTFFERLASLVIDDSDLIEVDNWSFQIAPALQRLARVTSTGGARFTLLVDGMDYALRDGRSNRTYLVDLLNATIQVNAAWHSVGHKAKVILLLRDEVMANLPDPNLNKKKSDHGVQLKWYDNTIQPMKSRLVSVIGQRARLAGYPGDTAELINSWFPASQLSRVLDHTRHLPRDLIRVFHCLQQIGQEPPFLESHIRTALANYSPWFLDELLDSLKGLVTEPVRIGLPRLLSRVGAEFEFKQFERAVAELNVPTDPLGLAELLYSTSWIGNVRTHSSLGSARQWTWYHRNPHTSLDPSRICATHRGLFRALNIVA